MCEVRREHRIRGLLIIKRRELRLPKLCTASALISFAAAQPPYIGERFRMMAAAIPDERFGMAPTRDSHVSVYWSGDALRRRVPTDWAHEAKHEESVREHCEP